MRRVELAAFEGDLLGREGDEDQRLLEPVLAHDARELEDRGHAAAVVAHTGRVLGRRRRFRVGLTQGRFPREQLDHAAGFRFVHLAHLHKLSYALLVGRHRLAVKVHRVVMGGDENPAPGLGCAG